MATDNMRHLGITGVVLSGGCLIIYLLLFSSISFEPLWNKSQWDALPIVLGIELIFFTLITLTYTILYQNPFSCIILVCISIQHAVLYSIFAWVGETRISPVWIKYIIICLSWCSVIPFIWLQYSLWRLWGWYIYNAVGGSRETQQQYALYQQSIALLLLDMYHAFLLISIEELLLDWNNNLHYLFCLISAILTVLLVLPNISFLRSELKLSCYGTLILYFISLSGYLYVVITNIVAYKTSSLLIKPRHGVVTESGSVLLIFIFECSAVFVRVLLIISIIRLFPGMNGQLRQALDIQRELRYTALLQEANNRTNNSSSATEREVHVFDACSRLLNRTDNESINESNRIFALPESARQLV